MNKLQLASKIKSKRIIAAQNDSPELQEKRITWLNKLCGKETIMPLVFEMYENEGEPIKSKKQIPQYLNEVIYSNTRTKIKNETRAEIDKLTFDKAVDVLCEICSALVRNKIHFCVFYAEGQRSPHVIIFDIGGLAELSPYKRLQAQAKFWRRISPFSFHFLDHSIWDDDHYLPMEFSPHWKYGTPFNLVFEYLPSQSKTYEDIITENRANALKFKEAYKCKI